MGQVPQLSRAAAEYTVPAPGQEGFIAGAEPQAGAVPHGRRGDPKCSCATGFPPSSPPGGWTPQGQHSSAEKPLEEGFVALALLCCSFQKFRALKFVSGSSHHGNRALWVLPPHCWHSRIDLTPVRGAPGLTPLHPSTSCHEAVWSRGSVGPGPQLPCLHESQFLHF